MTLTNDSNITVSSNATVEINAVDGVHIGDGNTSDVVILPAGTLFLKFVAAQPEHWAGESPRYVWDALDRIAAALAASGHQP